jgi:hypothetical protein
VRLIPGAIRRRIVHFLDEAIAYEEERARLKFEVEPCERADAFSYARGDLEELWEASREKPDARESISKRVYQNASNALLAAAKFGAAPEVNGLDNGVVQLLWTAGDGFVSVEIGDHSYGMIHFSDGRTVFKRNGELSELSSLLNEKANNLRDCGKAKTARGGV